MRQRKPTAVASCGPGRVRLPAGAGNWGGSSVAERAIPARCGNIDGCCVSIHRVLRREFRRASSILARSNPRPVWGRLVKRPGADGPDNDSVR